MMKLSIVLVNYNVKYFLEQTLLSVRKAVDAMHRADPSHKAEVIVVDNNSVDGSCAMVREQFPEVRLMANQENMGFARANNQAIKEASGEYILLLNPDTVLEEDTLRQVVDFMDAHPEAGGLGVKMVDGKGQFLPESKRMFPSPEVAFYKAFGLSALFPRSRTFGKYHLGYLDKNESHQVDVLAGAFMLVRSKVIQKIGLLDETFFMYGEDIDFSYRIKQAGYENYYYPHTRIIHYKGESTKKQSINYVFVFYKAMIIFAKKHFSRQKAALFTVLLNLAIYFRAGLAIGYRLLKRLVLPAIDYGLLLLAMYLTIWEYADGPIIDPPYYYHLPVAAFIWVLAAALTGNYQTPFAFWQVLKGAFAGTLGVAAVYAFLPDGLQVFRPMILTGGVLSFGVMTATRMAYQLIRHGNLWLGHQGTKEVIIVGWPDEAQRVERLLADSGVSFAKLGTVLPEPSGSSADTGHAILGNIHQLGEITTIYHPDEIIFCASDVPSQTIISWMVNIPDQQVDFKIAPEERLFIIGSHSKDMPGDFYTIDITLALAQTGPRFRKYLLDFVLAGMLLVTLPIYLLLIKNKREYIELIWKVLKGQRSWVGYHETAAHDHLPQLRKGIFTPPAELKSRNLDQTALDRLNFLYARDYTVEKDLRILAKNFLRFTYWA